MKTKKFVKNIKYNILIILFELLFYLNIISCESDECQRECPIKIGVGCKLAYCDKLQYSNGDCKISNPIIKTQWLNDIILVGEKNFRYVGMLLTSNKDLVFATSSCPSGPDRIYYGVNPEGKPLFGDNFIIKKTITRSEKKDRYESIVGIMKMNGDNSDKEYFINIGKSKTYTEILDLSSNENNLYELKYEDATNKNIRAYYGSYFNINQDDTNYLIISFITDDPEVFYLLKLKFTINSNQITCTTEGQYSLDSQNHKTTSCIMDEESEIICIFFEKSSLKETILFLDQNLNKLEKKTHSLELNDPNIFFKLIHLKRDISLFTYYKGINNDFPNIQVIKTSKNPYSYEIIKIIELNYENSDYNNVVMMSDIIKLRDNVICLTSTTKEKDILIIVLINFYYELEYNVRYYLIQIYQLYNIKILKELITNTYNNNLAVGFSFCQQSVCTSDDDPHFTSIILFSYPNITDDNIDLIDYLNKEGNNNITINLEDTVIIDNNIFGYGLYGIKIYDIDNCGINFISNKTGNVISINDTLQINEILTLEFINEEIISSTCSIKYRAIITEPDYEEYNQFPNYILYQNNENEKNNFTKNLYEGKKGQFDININEGITTNCGTENINCNLCLKNNKGHCLLCKFDFEDNLNGKICHEEILPTTIIEEKPTTIIEKIPTTTIEEAPTTIIEQTPSSIIEEAPTTMNYNSQCGINEILKDQCLNIALTNNELKEFYGYVKENILNKNNNNIYLFASTKNVKFQITTLNEQKKIIDDFSSIDLQECEGVLKSYYKLEEDEDLIILKIDMKDENSIITYVKYEVYEPINITLLDLSICNQNMIINSPIYLDEETRQLYDSLKNSGYDLFNSSDPFYNDICTPYTTINNTDIILTDRKNIIFINNGNKTLCQDNCSLNQYDTINNRALCECSIQNNTKEPDLEEVKNENYPLIGEHFLQPIKNSNFRVLKCYDLVFNINNIIKNIGMILMTIILFISIILFFVYLIKEKNKINYYINSTLKKKKLATKNKPVNKNINPKNTSQKTIISIGNKKSNQKPKKKFWSSLSLGKNIKIKNYKKLHSPKKKAIENITKKPIKMAKKMQRKGSISIYAKKRIPVANKNSNSSGYNSINNFIKKEMNKEYKSTQKINVSHKKKINFNDMNDQEKNTLNYRIAKEYDKRTYFQFYWSLLKKKHLILFSFVPANDYNLLSIKISLFLHTFSLLLTMNGFFMNDETMHKIYEDYGAFNIFHQTLQIIYSTIISSTINLLLRMLSLSENHILEIKKEKNINKATKLARSIKKLIKIKFIFFFISSFLLLLFFWYFISCFCIVYVNTQYILIEDTLCSFGLSMLYPFGLDLIPGIFRISALRSKKKNKQCLYKLSLLLASLI